ncbi:MAG: 2,3-bisphosphoglycerate-independent phosphoglycerate mutase [bacterium]|nr:2,3-bisphosphoglycerate-independent phosphoglycerate mutase [bacterium]
MRPKPVVLAIIDGWGVAPDSDGNAILRAKTPNYDKFIREYPAMTLYASGNEVGLQFGEMGNSEVGHLNIGAGRVYYQTYPRINKSISDGSFFTNDAFLKVNEHVKNSKSALHLIGLISPGNVHASQSHCYALLEFAKRNKIKKVYVHVILDGRDTLYNGGIDYVEQLEKRMKELKVGEIATISGRYYAMDRDNRWDRTEKAYRAMAEGKGKMFENFRDAIEESYRDEVFDEEFVPIVIGEKGEPKANIESEDGVIFFNFRPDRARQLTEAFVLPTFVKFEREYIRDVFFVTMTEYEKEIPVIVAYPPVVVHNSLAQAISDRGLKQFHIAETEKYAHITYFLNGTVEEPFEGEERMIIPSPKVASYVTVPEMSSAEITKEVVRAIESERFDAIFLNYANPDMVAHTSNYDATVLAVESVDKGLGEIAEHVLAKDGVFLITGDHGNAEEVINLQTGDINKEHSTNPVPLLIISNKYRGEAATGGDAPDGDLSLINPVGVLADVAPTILGILEIDLPPEMTGRALLV